MDGELNRKSCKMIRELNFPRVVYSNSRIIQNCPVLATDQEHVSPAVVKKLMGHRYETTSINWYASASDEEVREASRNRKYKKKY